MISGNLRKVRQELQNSCALVSRNKEEVTLIGVTKSVDLEKTIELANLGVLDIAENRVGPFLAKKAEMQDFSKIRWHFIGNLQRRKVKSVINEIDYFHALDSLNLAKEIQKRANHCISCFVEVNSSGERTKQGILPDELENFINELQFYDKICVVGLMTMAPKYSTEKQQHQIFGQLKSLQVEIAKKELSYALCTQTSMGMTNDFPIAVQEGATYIRIGTALFKE